MQNYQKYANAIAAVSVLAWIGICLHMGWY